MSWKASPTPKPQNPTEINFDSYYKEMKGKKQPEAVITPREVLQPNLAEELGRGQGLLSATFGVEEIVSQVGEYITD